jgi:hypothetical protein
MRRYCVPVVCLALSGCIDVPFVYLPEEAPTKVLGGCHFQARLFARDGVALDFITDSDSSMANPLRSSLQFDIPKAQTARFLDSRVTISGPSYSMSLTAELYGCPELYRSTHVCFWDAPRISGEEVVVVTLPPVEVNGARYDIKPIRFLPQRKLCVWVLPG